MATNFIQPAKTVTVEKASVSAGDPVVVESLKGVAQGDTNADGNVEVATCGAFKLAVVGNDGSSAAAIAFGEKVYYDSGDLNVNTGGTFFGIALGAVDSGETTEIPVMIVQG